ncbi:MAG: prolipoprotein diacylglyceryl transferase [Anaerolineales bacterium]|nr:prolipoprotein diacylglyceryl transferase [Anaerolineales bacterium]
MLPILRVGPLAIQIPGLTLLLGIYLGLTLVEKTASRRGLKADPLVNLALIGLLAGVVGARLSFVLQHLAIFRQAPASLISLDRSLLDPWGGVGIGLLAALVYGQRKGLVLLTALDALTPGLAVFAVALGLSHAASGLAFGAPTTLPWGVELRGATRHPSQIYEVLTALAILAVLWKQFRQMDSPGRLFVRFIALSAAARLLLEAFRGDSQLIFGGLRLVQALAWLVLAVCLYYLEFRLSATDKR